MSYQANYSYQSLSSSLKMGCDQDEIGTPHTITIDFKTLEDDTVTVRDRDTTKQERVKVDSLGKAL